MHELTMTLHLATLAKQGISEQPLTLKERLPAYIHGPLHLMTQYQVEAKQDYFVLKLHVSGELLIDCQRCMDAFSIPYQNTTELALVKTDERAEQLLSQYECVLCPTGQIDLADLVIDELYLYAPLFHLEEKDCNEEIRQIIAHNNETY